MNIIVQPYPLWLVFGLATGEQPPDMAEHEPLLVVGWRVGNTTMTPMVVGGAGMVAAVNGDVRPWKVFPRLSEAHEAAAGYTDEPPRPIRMGAI